MCYHGELFLAESTDTLLKAFKSARDKRGLLESLYVDNGSIYSSQEISQVCQRIGCILCHTPVRDGAAKGKIERFFRTVRMSFLTRQLEHSWLGMRPIDRFGLDLPRVRFLPPSDVNEELFFVEQDRSVLADNTFSLKNTRFEAPRDLRNRKVQIRFDRLKSERAVVYYKGERMGEARAVDFIGNDRKPSRKANAASPAVESKS